MVISAVPITIHLPAALWQAVQALAPHEGDATTVILRAVEEYIAPTAKRRGHRSGKYQKLVKALRTPVAALHLSARPASALRMLNIRYVYELVQTSRRTSSASRTSVRSRHERSRRSWRLWA
jgi:hypothetical protein